ncbi:MAG: nicotinate-nucleotide adenylyltransferase [Leptolyngbyaceae bacterium]|nr:nicotinate-nucleotide adenylyltransferase [Leptolyngbyaceae bacterium]
MTTLALFGTSADPPTAGHQQILRWLSSRYDQVIAWASDNPLKVDQTPLMHRAAMLRLLINDIEPPQYNLQCRQDLSHPRTITTIDRVRQEWPDAILTFVIGSDLVGQLPRWYQADQLIEQVKLLVVPRPGYHIQTADLDALREMGATVAIANLQGLPISSTASREAVRHNFPHTIGLTPPIRDYILREHLYRTCHSPKQHTNVGT